MKEGGVIMEKRRDDLCAYALLKEIYDHECIFAPNGSGMISAKKTLPRRLHPDLILQAQSNDVLLVRDESQWWLVK